MRICFSLLIIVFSSYFVFPQKNFIIESQLFTGKVVPHRKGMESLAKNLVRGVNLNFLIKNTEKNVFSEYYNYPLVGFGLHYDYLGNPEVLGEAFASYMIADFCLLRKNNFSLNSRLSPGLAYISKIFNQYDNPENVAIGTHLNFYLNWDFSLIYHNPESNFSYRISSALVHYSNGAVIKPNKGLNQILLQLGLSYHLSENKQTFEKSSLKNDFKNNEFWILATISTSDDYAHGDVGRGGGFLSSTSSIGYNKRYTATGKYGIAADFFYEENFYYYFDRNWDTLVQIRHKPLEILRGGISIGHEFVYNKLSFISYAGFYYYRKVKPNEWFYTRIGLKYYPINNMFINLSLKAFGFKAHYIESGIGFSLYRD